MDQVQSDNVARILKELGFLAAEKGWFEGRIEVGGKSFSTRIGVPDEFPAKLPHIYFDETELPGPIAHVEEVGKVCIAHSTGLLLDRRNPEGILRESIERAKR